MDQKRSLQKGSKKCFWLKNPRLLIQYHTINGNMFKWIDTFLKQRSQCTVVDGKQSSWTHIYSVVPQGIVCGSL